MPSLVLGYLWSFSVPTGPVSSRSCCLLLAIAGNTPQEEQVSGSFFDFPAPTAILGEEVGAACPPCPTSHTTLHFVVSVAHLLPSHSDHHNLFPLAPCGRWLSGLFSMRLRSECWSSGRLLVLHGCLWILGVTVPAPGWPLDEFGKSTRSISFGESCFSAHCL